MKSDRDSDRDSLHPDCGISKDLMVFAVSLLEIGSHYVAPRLASNSDLLLNLQVLEITDM